MMDRVDGGDHTILVGEVISAAATELEPLLHFNRQFGRFVGGGAEQVIKLVFCLRRKPGMSLAEFQDYWLNKHGPLVRSHAKTLRIRRYVQTHTHGRPGDAAGHRQARGAPEAFDGVAELWWESREDMAAPLATPEGRAASLALLEDERKFIDHANSPAVDRRRAPDRRRRRVVPPRGRLRTTFSY